jgi:hypothetical protein
MHQYYKNVVCPYEESKKTNKKELQEKERKQEVRKGSKERK